MNTIVLFLQKPFLWAHHNAKIRKFFKTLDRIIITINKNIAVFGLGLGVFITALNVSVRYIAGFYPDIGSLTWAEEVARYCFLWSVFFGAAYGFRKGVHISVMMVIEKLPPFLAKICVIFSHLLTSVFLGFMFYASLMVILLNYELGYMSEALHNVPLWVFLLCLPLAFLGATYRSVEKIYETSWMSAKRIAKNTKEEMLHDSVLKD